MIINTPLEIPDSDKRNSKMSEDRFLILSEKVDNLIDLCVDMKRDADDSKGKRARATMAVLAEETEIIGPVPLAVTTALLANGFECMNTLASEKGGKVDVLKRDNVFACEAPPKSLRKPAT